MSDSVLYVLPKPDFFANGRRGRVTHAIGVGSGLAANGVNVLMLSGEGTRSYGPDLGRGVRIEEVPGGGPAWFRRLRARIAALLHEDSTLRYIIIRYAVSNGRRFLSLMRGFPDRRWIFEVNSLAYHQYGDLPAVLRHPLLVHERRILRKAHALYVVSRTLRTDLCLGRKGIAEARIFVVPNAGNRDLARPAEQDECFGDGTRTVGKFVYLGMFHDYYDFVFVLRAFRQLVTRRPAAELHFYGDGERLPYVRSQARGIPNTYFHGRYDLNEMLQRGQIGGDWILLLPYRPAAITTIGSPTKLFEYMALGRPILASAHGQPHEILAEGDTASIYDPERVDDLTERMEYLMDHPERGASMGRAARAAFLCEHTWSKRMADLWERISNLP